MPNSERPCVSLMKNKIYTDEELSACGLIRTDREYAEDIIIYELFKDGIEIAFVIIKEIEDNRKKILNVLPIKRWA